MADSLIVKNWHFAGINYTENLVVVKQKADPDSNTGLVHGVVTKKKTCDLILEAQLVPPLDPNDILIPGTSIANPARYPVMSMTSDVPPHECYVDLGGVMHCGNLGASDSSFSPAPSTAGGWGNWRRVGDPEIEYFDEIIPVKTWRIRCRSIKSITKKMSWNGSIDLDKFDAG